MSLCLFAHLETNHTVFVYLQSNTIYLHEIFNSEIVLSFKGTEEAVILRMVNI